MYKCTNISLLYVLNLIQNYNVSKYKSVGERCYDLTPNTDIKDNERCYDLPLSVLDILNRLWSSRLDRPYIQTVHNRVVVMVVDTPFPQGPRISFNIHVADFDIHLMSFDSSTNLSDV
jgi:hypothetical protein